MQKQSYQNYGVHSTWSSTEKLGVSGAERSAYSVSEGNPYCYEYQLRKEEIKNGIIPNQQEFRLTELGDMWAPEKKKKKL